MRKTKNSLFLP